MKEKFRKISEAMDRYIETKSFRWFRTLILLLGFTVTGCVCFLAGFFLNRQDNMIYQSNIRVMERTDEEAASPVNAASAEDTQEEQTEETAAVTTAVTTTMAPKVTLSRELLDSYIYEDLVYSDYEYRYSNTAAFKNRTTVYDYGVPLTKKAFTLSYEGIITVGLNPDDIKVETDDERYTITITLPEGYIISHETDPDSFELENVQDSFFNPISYEDYYSVCESQNYKMEQRAAASGMYAGLYRQTEEQIAEYLNRDGVIGAEYTINFIHPENL